MLSDARWVGSLRTSSTIAALEYLKRDRASVRGTERFHGLPKVA